MTQLALDLVDAALQDAPDRLAVAGADGAASRGEVRAASSRIAHLLRDHGRTRGARVGLCVPPGPTAVAGVLGVLRSGATLVALDASTPSDRLACMVRQAEIGAVVATRAAWSRLAAAWPGAPELVLLLDGDPGAAGGPATTLGAAALARASAEPPPVVNAPEDPAYVIFTSGTTGAPKGVVIPHRALAASLRDGPAAIRMRAGDRVTQLAPLTFDAAVWEHLAPLACGASVHPVPHAALAEPEALLRFIAAERITWTYLPPALFTGWLAHLEISGGRAAAERLAGTLRCILFAGETLPPGAVRRWQEWMGTAVTLMNFYGPTETTVLVSGHVIDDLVGPSVTSIPIGKGFGENEVTVRDERGRRCAPGTPGEIHVGGPQLAAGYLGDPEKTRAAFIPDPERPERLLYRTGDLGVERPDGALDFLGRADGQVKIRGKRIELEGIEQVLRRHGAVRHAAVLVAEDAQGKRLVAFVAAPASVTARELRAHVLRELPEYMVPHRFVRLDELPTGATGKIDRAALAALEAALPPELEGDAWAPRDDAGRAVLEVWKAVLRRERIGVAETFRTAGGDSLLCFQALAALRRKGLVLGSCAAVDATPEAWASALQPAGELAALAADADGTLPLTPMQEEMFVLAAANPGANLYHIQFVFETDALDPAALSRAAGALMRTHETLRTVFRARGAGWRQVILPAAAVEDPTVSLVELPAASGAEEATLRRWMAEDHARSFDPAQLPLFRLTLVRAAARRFLCLTFFHQILDGWSFSQLFRELTARYEEARSGQPIREAGGAAIQASYLAHVEALRRSGVREAELRSWRARLAAPVPIVQVPPDREPAGPLRRSALHHAVTPGLRSALLALAAETRTSLHKVLLAGYFQLLHGLTGADEILAGNTVANRPPEVPDMDRALGCYISILPIRVAGCGRPLRALLPAVAEAMDGASAHARFPSEEVVAEVLGGAKRRGLCWRNIFALDNFPEDHDGDLVRWPPLSWNAIEPFDLALSVIDMHDRLYLYWNYRSDLFDAGTITRIGTRYAGLLAEACGCPAEPAP
jgi:amino acid adenylation domain-containing protein